MGTSSSRPDPRPIREAIRFAEEYGYRAWIVANDEFTRFEKALQSAEERAKGAESEARGWHALADKYFDDLATEREQNARLREALKDALSVVRDDTLPAGERLYDLDENIRQALEPTTTTTQEVCPECGGYGPAVRYQGCPNAWHAPFFDIQPTTQDQE